MTHKARFRPVKQCVFCPDKPDSKEHAWSDWAISRFQGPNDVIVGSIEERPYHIPGQKQILVRCVCEGCNIGWMHTLEDTVIPTAGCMMHDLSITLDIPQQWAIARWALKTAIVWEHLTRDRDIFYTYDERVALRLAGTIPAHTFIWLSRNAGGETFYTTGNDVSSLPASPRQFLGYLTTIAYKRLVIQILTIRADPKDPRPIRLDGDEARWRNAMVQLWPTADRAPWPPVESVPPNALLDFHRRFRGTTVKE